MPTTKQAAIAAATIAIWSAGPVFAQAPAAGNIDAPVLSDGRPGERASAVFRAIEGEGATTQAVQSAAPVDAPELARARAAGELRTTERGQPVQVERLQMDEPARPEARASTEAATRTAGSAQRRQIVRVDGGSANRTKTTGVVDDAKRYREQARYDTAKKRDATVTTAAGEQPGRGQRKAEITWSAPEPQDYRTAREGNERTLY